MNLGLAEGPSLKQQSFILVERPQGSRKSHFITRFENDTTRLVPVHMLAACKLSVRYENGIHSAIADSGKANAG